MYILIIPKFMLTPDYYVPDFIISVCHNIPPFYVNLNCLKCNMG